MVISLSRLEKTEIVDRSEATAIRKKTTDPTEMS